MSSHEDPRFHPHAEREHLFVVVSMFKDAAIDEQSIVLTTAYRDPRLAEQEAERLNQLNAERHYFMRVARVVD